MRLRSSPLKRFTSDPIPREIFTRPDVYTSTGRFLTGAGHDVLRFAEIALAQADDEVVLAAAEKESRLLVTRDRDFGGLVFVKNIGAGVIYLRILPSTQNAVHDELGHVLELYPESELRRAFVVIEPGGHRLRKPPPVS